MTSSSPSLRDLAAQAAYMKSMIEFVRAQADAVAALAFEPVHLDSLDDNAVAEATSRNGIAMREHLELAIRYGQDWHREVNQVLTRATARARRSS